MNKVIKEKVMECLGKTTYEQNDALKITELDLKGMELKDIYDLKAFKNLIKLDLTDNFLSDLNPLSELVQLEELYAWNNPFKTDEEKANEKGRIELSDMTFLKHLSNLVNIDFTNTGITDIEFVKWLPNLEIMRVYCNDISDISPISILKELKQVFFFDCNVSDISVFSQLPDIEGIAINMNKVSDLSPLKDCVKITYLDAHTNNITDISPLIGMTEMRYLTLENNNIEDINPLVNMTKMTHLTLSNNSGIKDFDVIKELASLNHLEIRNLNISESEISELSGQLKNCKIVI